MDRVVDVRIIARRYALNDDEVTWRELPRPWILERHEFMANENGSHRVRKTQVGTTCEEAGIA